MATASLPQPQPTLYHTNLVAFMDALRAIAPELQRQASEFSAMFAREGLLVSERECMGYAAEHLLQLATPTDADYDYMADAADPIYALDYNDEELLACGIDRS